MKYLIFLIIFTATYFFMNIFVWLGSLKLLSLKNPSHERVLTYIFVFLFLIPILNFFVKEAGYSGKVVYFTNYISYFWLFFVFYLTILYLIFLPLNKFFNNPFIFKIAPFLILFIITLYGLYESGNVVKREITIKTSLKNDYKILFFADIHFELIRKERNYRKVLEIIEGEKPDLILIGGDIFEKETVKKEEPVFWLKKITKIAPVVSVVGNHEIYAGKKESIKRLEEAGVKVLTDSGSVFKELYIFGFDEKRRGFNLKLSEKELEKFVSGSEKFNIVLIHKPISIEEIAKRGAHLILAGHVHKGQFFPFSLFVKIGFKYFYGFYRLKDTIVYVTSGASTWGPPIRIFAKPEVVLIKLKHLK